jgi:DNA-binding transcriptional regulator YbjK
MSDVATRTPRGPADPTRPQRIAEAAVRIVSQRGVEGLTHRAVAAEAQVPVGSTTYYFKDLDDLLEAALQVVAEAAKQEMWDWSNALGPADDLAAALADFMVLLTEEQRGRVVVEYELYLAALRRPRLTMVTSEWSRTTADVLKPHTDDVTAELLAVLVDGFFVKALVLQEHHDREYYCRAFARLLQASTTYGD